MKSDLTFGYYDKSKFEGSIAWHPVLYKYMYGVQLDDIMINGKRMNLCKGKKCLITFDSGTSLMSVPIWAHEMLVAKKIPTANYVQPCKSHQQYGEMTLIINGIEYTLDNDEWMYQAKDVEMAQGGK